MSAPPGTGPPSATTHPAPSARRRQPAVLLTVAGLALAALADGIQPWDGPGPVIFATLAVVVAVFPRRTVCAGAAAICAFFVVGALINPENTRRLATPSDVLDFGTATAQLTGFVLGVLAGGLAARARPRTRSGGRAVAK